MQLELLMKYAHAVKPQMHGTSAVSVGGAAQNQLF